MTAVRVGALHLGHAAFRGPGYFAGEAPDPTDPASPDGRFRKLNVPARGRVVVLERSTMAFVTATRSAPDGTWRIGGLMDIEYVVIGFDDSGVQNAAVQDWVRPNVPE